LEFLARQQDRILAELGSLRDDVNVLTAIVQRLDNSHTRLLAEIGSTHSREANCRIAGAIAYPIE
jgi:t-SNARE complex subunit (syntaxin)